MKGFFLTIMAALVALTSVSPAYAQSFRIHKGLDVRETRDALDLASHADADSIVVVGATFRLAVDNITQTTCTLHVEPSNAAVRYYYDICTRQTLERDFGGNAAALVEGYLGDLYERYSMYFTLEEILAETLSVGADSDELTGLPAGTEMAFYAVAVDDAGRACGVPAVAYFTTAPAGNPADCTFGMSVDKVNSTACIISITPSDASVAYWYGICAASEWPGDYAITTDVSNALYEYARERGMSLADVASHVVYTGELSIEESGLTPSTAYYAYCYAMDTQTGDALGAVCKVRFETTDYDLSEAEVKLRVKLFDGDALLQAYPDRFSAGVKGRCYMQVSVEPNPYCYNWVVALAKGDLSDEAAFPDDITKNAVLQGGKFSHELNNFVCDWTPCTLFAFGVDAAGVDGELQRHLLTFTKADVSPVSEFLFEESASANAYIAITNPAKHKNNEKIRFNSRPGYRRCALSLGR